MDKPDEWTPRACVGVPSLDLAYSLPFICHLPLHLIQS